MVFSLHSESKNTTQHTTQHHTKTYHVLRLVPPPQKSFFKSKYRILYIKCSKLKIIIKRRTQFPAPILTHDEPAAAVSAAQVINSVKSIADPAIIADNNKQTVSVYSFFSTVASNKEVFSRLEIEGRADKARILQSRSGWPSDQQFKEAIRDNLVMNAGITVDDIHRTEAIYGKAVPIIKRKMVRKRPKHVSNVPRFRIPVPQLKHHPTDELDIDFLYTQGAPYVLSKTHKVKFQSVQCFNKISTQKKKTQHTTYK